MAYLYLPGLFTQRAENLLRTEPDWAAPILWRGEFRNILAGYLRRETLSFDQARAIPTEAEHLLAGNEHESDSNQVLELVRDRDCSAHDCEFAALAMRLGVKLMTVNAKLLKAFPKLAITFPAG